MPKSVIYLGFGAGKWFILSNEKHKKDLLWQNSRSKICWVRPSCRYSCCYLCFSYPAWIILAPSVNMHTKCMNPDPMNMSASPLNSVGMGPEFAYTDLWATPMCVCTCVLPLDIMNVFLRGQEHHWFFLLSLPKKFLVSCCGTRKRENNYSRAFFFLSSTAICEDLFYREQNVGQQ